VTPANMPADFRRPSGLTAFMDQMDAKQERRLSDFVTVASEHKDTKAHEFKARQRLYDEAASLVTEMSVPKSHVAYVAGLSRSQLDRVLADRAPS
jgi:hypothetical protein